VLLEELHTQLNHIPFEVLQQLVREGSLDSVPGTVSDLQMTDHFCKDCISRKLTHTPHTAWYGLNHVPKCLSFACTQMYMAHWLPRVDKGKSIGSCSSMISCVSWQVYFISKKSDVSVNLVGGMHHMHDALLLAADKFPCPHI